MSDNDASPTSLAAEMAMTMMQFIGSLLVGPFQLGIGGPRGWVILDKPEIRLGEDVFVPDLAGWLAERAPEPTNELYTAIVPDWIGEIDALETGPSAFVKKVKAYAYAGVRFMWLFDSADRAVTLHRLYGKDEWEVYGAYGACVRQSRVQAEPFDAIEIDTDLLWSSSPEPAR